MTKARPVRFRPGGRASRGRAAVNFLTRAALALGAASGFGHAATPATGAQNHEQIRAVAHAFAAREAARNSSRVEVEVGAIDPRLQLGACAAEIEAFWPAGAQYFGNTTVGVRCRSDTPWTLYVPVRVRSWQQVLVAARAVPRGAALAPGDVRLEPREAADLGRGYLSRPEHAVGRQAGRALAAGTVIAPSVLVSPPLVRRGDRVTVLVGNDRLEVRLTAEALADGRAGDSVRVRNPLTKRVIHGTVAGPGTVRVPL